MKRTLKSFLLTLNLLSLLLGVVHLLRVRSARGMALRSIKSFSEALAPFLGLAAAASALFSLLLGFRFSALIGAVGALLQGRYVRRVTSPHNGFETIFGADWQEHISPVQRRRWLQRRWTWRMPAQLPEPRWTRDLVYHTVSDRHSSLSREEEGMDDREGELDLHCDLWQPPANVPTAGTALIYIHGGGYFTSRKDFGTRALFRHLAEQGHVVMDIDYRLAPRADIFEMLHDVQHAIVWMKANAEWFGADPQRIVLAGGSAGAHLALLAAYARDQSRLRAINLQDADLSVRAVISYYGMIDLSAAYHSIQTFFALAPGSRKLPENALDNLLAGKVIELAAWMRNVDAASMREYLLENQGLMYAGLKSSMMRLVGGAPDEIPDIYQLISPLTYAGPGCPPTLLLQGEHDYLLSTEPARMLYQKLRSARVPAVYVELPQTEHTFDLFLPVVSPPAQAALYDVDRFLALVG